jgi:hypothetical protein
MEDIAVGYMAMEEVLEARPVISKILVAVEILVVAAEIDLRSTMNTTKEQLLRLEIDKQRRRLRAEERPQKEHRRSQSHQRRKNPRLISFHSTIQFQYLLPL